MATYGRGRHIAPSIRSVLDQTFPAHELVVVGDHCVDETEKAVSDFRSDRITWLNLPTRCGSQSAPNNAGISAARGEVIAYLGHDDIWERDHLKSLAALFAARSDLDFAVGGAIFHLPNALPGSQITGLFDDDAAKHSHFFPPSSFAHRRRVCDRIGFWNLPEDIRAPVDADFLLRAAAADMRFASTGRISVHKFAAGHRYLSYLRQTSCEQRAMLTAMTEPGHKARVAALVQDARQHGSFMTVRHADFSQFEPGELARQNAERKGLTQTTTRRVGRGAVLVQEPARCALDWEDTPEKGIRWVRTNPRPNLLIPFAGRRAIVAVIRVVHAERDALARLVLVCNGRRTEAAPAHLSQAVDLWQAEFRVVLPLRRDAPSVVRFVLDPAQLASAQGRGIGIGPITAVPAAPWSLREKGLRARLAQALNRRRLRQQRRELSPAGEVSPAIP